MAVSFAKDIRPLFRDEPEVNTMKRVGIGLSSCDDVKAKAAGIYERLDNGSMPLRRSLAQGASIVIQALNG